MRGSFALLLELMEVSLHHFLVESRAAGSGVEVRERCRLAHETAMGIAYLHRNSYLHGDVKALNVLMDATKRAKVCDFGISAAIGVATRGELPLAGEEPRQCPHSEPLQSNGLGTLRYLAPELVANTASLYDARCDVYSFGLLLWEVMHTKLAFDGSSEVAVAITLAPEGTRPTLDLPTGCDVLGSTISACWHHDPAARPAMSTCVEEIGSLLEGL